MNIYTGLPFIKKYQEENGGGVIYAGKDICKNITDQKESQRNPLSQ